MTLLYRIKEYLVIDIIIKLNKIQLFNKLKEKGENQHYRSLKGTSHKNKR